jgi:N-acetylglucosaminyldiphosphoundecaprenol N-acetyl-beta-D-mannosaminyltransferase
MPTCLDVPITSGTKNELLQTIEQYLDTDQFHMITTPNPEMLLAAAKSPMFRAVLHHADLSICDSFGLQVLAQGKVTRFPGVDVMQELLRIAEKKNKSVYFLGAEAQYILDDLIENVQDTYPNLDIAGSSLGPQPNHIQINGGHFEIASDTRKELIADLHHTKPNIVFVAFGHKKQELAIHDLAPDLPKSVQIAIGVGGAFEMLAGKQVRAPKLMRRLGLEWLWRVAKEPKRIGRIVDAVVKFPLYAMLHRLPYISMTK